MKRAYDWNVPAHSLLRATRRAEEILSGRRDLSRAEPKNNGRPITRIGRPSCPARSSRDRRDAYFFNASFASPTALCTAPFTLSTLPSVSSFLSPVILPAFSLMAPLALSAAPFTCSLSICFSLFVRGGSGSASAAHALDLGLARLVGGRLRIEGRPARRAVLRATRHRI